MQSACSSPLVRLVPRLAARHAQLPIRITPGRQLHTQHRPRIANATSGLQRRFASDETARQETIGDARSLVTRLKNVFFGTTIVLGLSFTYLYITDTRASVHEWLIVPTLRALVPDAEDAHRAGNNALKGLYSFGLHPRERGDVDAKGDLKVEVFGHVLDNPIGTSAGLDKNAEIPDPIMALGPGLVEVGGATPFPQEGNPKPRVWRIPSQNALINRYGLNSEGADSIALRLRQRVRAFAYNLGLGVGADAERKVLDGEAGVPPGSLTPGRLLAVQCAKMKGTPGDDIAAVAQDYVYCVKQLGKYADIIVVNVSSPNTPGLRSLQATGPLTAILSSVVGAAQGTDRKTKPAVMVKVSPDEDSEEQVRGICDAVWASGVDGVIVGNTTNKRPDPLPRGYILPAKDEQILLETGGYSGPQLFEKTVSLVKKYRTMLDLGPPPAKPDEKPITASDNKDKGKSGEIESAEQTTKRDEQRLKPLSDGSESQPKQPLIRLPELPKSTAEALNPTQQKDKVIFATGGITNGKQALEVLNAGASVAMVYTALVYGGAGTITRIKSEMRQEIGSKKSN